MVLRWKYRNILSHISSFELIQADCHLEIE